MTEEEQKKAEQEKMENDKLVAYNLIANDFKIDMNFFKNLLLIKNGNLNKVEKQEFQIAIFAELMKMYNANNTSINEKPENENIQENKPVEVENTPLFLDAAFFKGRRTLLFANTGGGKSLMSIAIARSSEVKKPLFILVDNVGTEDTFRYRQALGDKAVIITLKNFEKKAHDIEQAKINNAQMQIMLERLLTKENVTNIHNVENITNRVYERMGIKGKPDNNIDAISVLVSIMEEAIKEMNVDFICIDALNGIIDPRKYTREKVQKILKPAADAKITTICLHHTNKRKNDYAGSSAIGEAVDYLYHLYEDASVIPTANNERILVLEEQKARYSTPQIYKIKCSYFNDRPPKYELLEQSPFWWQGIDNKPTQNLTQRIEAVLLECGNNTIEFEELIEELGNPPPDETVIKNYLKKLERRHKVEKTDNHWKTIKIVR